MNVPSHFLHVIYCFQKIYIFYNDLVGFYFTYMGGERKVRASESSDRSIGLLMKHAIRGLVLCEGNSLQSFHAISAPRTSDL